MKLCRHTLGVVDNFVDTTGRIVTKTSKNQGLGWAVPEKAAVHSLTKSRTYERYGF
jgi:hypothetical protein